MATPTLIGLVGEKESGKDTVGAMLAEYGFERRAFADPLKQEVCDCLNGSGFPRVEPFVVPQDIRRIIAVYRGRGEESFAKPTSADMRRLLQWWGTEFRRKFDNNHWVKLSANDVPELAVFTDVRFPNEVSFIRGSGGALVKVNRTGPAAADTHVSESLAKSDDMDYDFVIDNNGTIADLQALVAKTFGPVVTAPLTQPIKAEELPVPEPVAIIEVPAPQGDPSGVAQGEGLVVPTETAP